MQRVLLLFFIISAMSSYGQDVIMQNGTLNTCSGTFFDSGGEFSNYLSGEDFTLTLCPETVGEKLKLSFTEFATQLNVDIMSIYDGDTVSSPIIGDFSGTNGSDNPGIILASDNNVSGCLTIKFISNDAAVTSGWIAEISCVTPCQEIIADLDATMPLPNADGIIQVCVNEEISLNGSGTFSADGTGAAYEWDLGDGNFESGASATYAYDTPGVYIINLNIRDVNTDIFPEGCSNSNRINQVIQVAATPDFTGTQANDDILCFGETTTLEGIVNAVPVIYNCPPPLSDVTALPDGAGASYSTCVTVDCFESDALLTDASQLSDICLNIEHSYLGDLDIIIMSPNGQQVILKSFAAGGGGVFLGSPIDDNEGTSTPGVGADYCFSESGIVLLVDGPTINTGTPSGPSIVPGTYLPEASFSGLIGSPLNGEWCIEITDNLVIDNGFIFSWEINFDPNLDMQDFSFTSEITSEAWDNDPSITNVDANTITVTPPTAGEYCYTYRVTDDFGCEYAQEVCVNVAEEGQEPVTYYEDFDGDGFGNPDNSRIECTAIDGFVTNNADCDDTNEAINPDAEDVEGNGIDENCDGVDGNALSLSEVMAKEVSIHPNPFNAYFSFNMPPSIKGDSDSLHIEIYDLNGRLVFNKIQSNINGLITINNVAALKDAPYFIKITAKDNSVSVIKKLIKLSN